MFRYTCFYMVPLLMALVLPFNSHAATDHDIQDIHDQLLQLDKRLQQAESNTNRPPPASASAFNPAISLILAASYNSLSQDPNAPITGFPFSPNNHGYHRSFGLNESELGISASIDPQFRGVATFSFSPDGSTSVENAFVQTDSLGYGINLKLGRFFSGLGYLNEQHAHAWDFIDQPLVYRTFWDNQLGEDGLQLKWLAPTDTFFELGAEIGRGRGYPGSDRQNNNGAGAEAIYAHWGDDFNLNNSWRAGLSLHQTKRVNAVADAFGVSNSFSGDNITSGLDFIWKYAPNGNTSVTSLKLQGEYFQRREYGLLSYNTAGVDTTDVYRVAQSGWYVQSIYQFKPHWRAGLRYDQLNPGNAEVGPLISGNIVSSYAFTPSRYTLMLDYSPSEFSRLRLQIAEDQSRRGKDDHQLFLQYIMSLGAHGAHQF